jgi:hypothetical protein
VLRVRLVVWRRVVGEGAVWGGKKLDLRWDEGEQGCMYGSVYVMIDEVFSGVWVKDIAEAKAYVDMSQDLCLAVELQYIGTTPSVSVQSLLKERLDYDFSRGSSL